MADSFLAYLNCQNENIKFTIEKEKENILPFLDIYIKRTESGINTSIYKKETDTGLLSNYNSFVSFKYKIYLIKALLDRIFKINNTWSGFHNDLENMKETLQKNSFTSKIIDQNINKSLNDKLSKNCENKN